jgi:hypothetical protein
MIFSQYGTVGLFRNKYLAEVVQQFLDEYKECGNNKSKKSEVLNKIATSLTSQRDPPTRFVRFEPKHQRWYEIEAFYAREKISQCCRDLAKDGYRSANSFKNLKRRKSYTNDQPQESTGASNYTVPDPDSRMEPRVEPPSKYKRIPPKKVAAGKAAATDSDVGCVAQKEDNDIPGALSKLSKKEQLERQIAKLKKELEQLEEDEQGGEDGNMVGP